MEQPTRLTETHVGPGLDPLSVAHRLAAQLALHGNVHVRYTPAPPRSRARRLYDAAEPAMNAVWYAAFGLFAVLILVMVAVSMITRPAPVGAMSGACFFALVTLAGVRHFLRQAARHARRARKQWTLAQ